MESNGSGRVSTSGNVEFGNAAAAPAASVTETTAAEQLAARYERDPRSGLFGKDPRAAVMTCTVHRAAFLAFCSGCAQEFGLTIALTARSLADKNAAECDGTSPSCRAVARANIAEQVAREAEAQLERPVPDVAAFVERETARAHRRDGRASPEKKCTCGARDPQPARCRSVVVDPHGGGTLRCRDKAGHEQGAQGTACWDWTLAAGDEGGPLARRLEWGPHARGSWAPAAHWSETDAKEGEGSSLQTRGQS